ncbi:hypothetical protein LTR78_006740 [Recurvomyces mirabilis]|uniref:Uncharacterized protein n=1 Tax=Recurvomyces mirabilis TaxID=574656 RepID=A0AAE1BZP0_9PEZI|nr:hypothetical protein LTR78_006740 [Recurvomyces mirabilis]KAK5151371.1 hypothetical protein LTS14_009214 [Recurvomyces mirabilis]
MPPYDLKISLENQEDQWLEICVEILVDKISKHLDMPLSDDFIRQKIEEAEKELALDRAKRGLLPGQQEDEGIVPYEEEMDDRPFIANYARRMEGSFYTPLELANVPAFLAQGGPRRSLKEMEAAMDNWRPCRVVKGCVWPANPMGESTRSGGGVRYSFGAVDAGARGMERRVGGLREYVERNGGGLMGIERRQRVAETVQRKVARPVAKSKTEDAEQEEISWETDEEFEAWIALWDQEQIEKQARERENKKRGKVKQEAAIVSSLFLPKQESTIEDKDTESDSGDSVHTVIGPGEKRSSANELTHPTTATPAFHPKATTNENTAPPRRHRRRHHSRTSSTSSTSSTGTAIHRK